MCQCGRVWSRPDLEKIYNAERDAARLAAVWELVKASKRMREVFYSSPLFDNALEALRAVWPEAVEE